MSGEDDEMGAGVAEKHNDHGSPMDYAEHEKTYGVFAGLIKWGSAGTVIFVLITGALTGVLPWAFALIASLLVALIAAMF